MVIKPLNRLPALTPAIETIAGVGSQWRRKKLPTALFLAICFNLIVAPLVYAAGSNALSRSQAWSLGLLGLATVALAVYLFFVMFVPERF